VPVPRGSSVLLPAPFWQGFHWSFRQGPGLHVVPARLGADFELTLDALRHAYETANPRPKLLALTNPHNPLGVNYGRDLLESVYSWALNETDIHAISDEMYCHSQLHPGREPAFVSALALDATRAAPERVHVVWGFAKDFGLSGFRAGFLISRSPHVHSAMQGHDDWLVRRKGLAWFSAFDSLKHRLLLPLASDAKTWEGVIGSYQGSLRGSHAAVAGQLDQAKVPYRRSAGAGQFFWLDLREYLPAEAADGESLLFAGPSPYKREQQLADDILRHAHVKLLTGGAMYCPVEGYYRLCYTALDKNAMQDAVASMIRYLGTRTRR
jgi:aspartate/methionine/tyrosine aminotransferase